MAGRFQFVVAGVFACLSLLCLPAVSQAETYYFMTVFGSECHPPKPQCAHSFATIVKATGHGSDYSQYELEVHSISWLPETMDIKVWRMTPEPGDNFGLFETLDWAIEVGADIRQYGPFQITCDTYRRALHRISIMDQDLLQYQAVDPVLRTEISNCIHAISGIDPYDPRTRYPLIRIGHSASEHIAEVFHQNGLIISPEANHHWLDHRMGLQCYPIEHGEIEVPLIAAGFGRPGNRRHEILFPEASKPVRPDFVIPPGIRNVPRGR